MCRPRLRGDHGRLSFGRRHDHLVGLPAREQLRRVDDDALPGSWAVYVRRRGVPSRPRRNGCRITRRWSGPRRRYTALAVERRACAAAAAQRHYVRRQRIAAMADIERQYEYRPRWSHVLLVGGFCTLLAGSANARASPQDLGVLYWIVLAVCLAGVV